MFYIIILINLAITIYNLQLLKLFSATIYHILLDTLFIFVSAWVVIKLDWMRDGLSVRRLTSSLSTKKTFSLSESFAKSFILECLVIPEKFT